MAFRIALGFHILAGLTCVVSGIVAMMSAKRAGRHPRAGTLYFYAFAVVFASATAIAVMRWAEDAYLFGLGAVGFGLVTIGYVIRRRQRPGWRLPHITAMGGSYIVLLTAFYVDNGPNLPGLRLLPTLTFWIAPSAIGVTLIGRALVRHRALPWHGRQTKDTRLASAELTP